MSLQRMIIKMYNTRIFLVRCRRQNTDLFEDGERLPVTTEEINSDKIQHIICQTRRCPVLWVHVLPLTILLRALKCIFNAFTTERVEIYTCRYRNNQKYYNSEHQILIKRLSKWSKIPMRKKQIFTIENSIVSVTIFLLCMKKMNRQTVITLAMRKYLCRNMYRIQPDVMMWFALL
ncbi:uncharacterized protein LOC105735540 [Apis florea]|uniref:uncharacterized protein LOC105735540 n=1 Tax=Apis florea TaxID=7463 RepID=UPI0006292001|nr:uncharacterized protein LOC105735540 [Apis florea]